MQDILQIIKKYYEANMDKGLPDYSMLGWESEEAQALRFEMLAANVPLQGRKILDVGCGVGNLAEYLGRRSIQSDYTGVDILQSMICRAKEKKLGARFLHCDIFKENPFKNEKFDVVYSSGIFNLNLSNNMEFLRRAIDTFLDLSDGIVAFNLLSNKSLDKEDKYFYYDMEKVENLIRNEFSSRMKSVDLICGYLHNDFTVICTKTGEA